MQCGTFGGDWFDFEDSVYFVLKITNPNYIYMFGSLRRKEGFSDFSRYKSVVDAMTGIDFVKLESLK